MSESKTVVASRKHGRPSSAVAPVDSGDFDVTRNACIVCAPLGATLAFAGVARGMTLLHGSQGCATYIRRYTISHFREPLDAASSSFTEESAVFGGAGNLRLAFSNLVREYAPALVGVSTTCLAETIGEDASVARRALADFATETGPLIAVVSTPSYRGDHREGFRAALRALVEAACGAPGVVDGGAPPLAVFPTILSPADLRSIKDTFAAFGFRAVLVSDYSDTLDGGPWKDEGIEATHRLLPDGGTKVEALRTLRWAVASIEFGQPIADDRSGASYLESAFGVPRRRVPLPIGVGPTDAFLENLCELSGQDIPATMEAERARLLDSYVDAHKHVFGARALLYGDEDLRQALSVFCREIGMEPVIAAGEGRDFAAVEEVSERSAAAGRPIDILIGNSKGYKTSVKLGVPLVRVGFPIHDRFGGQRVRTLGYGGTQELFDRVVNALIERKQENSDVGYTYY